MNSKNKVIIIGAGLSGTLLAIRLAQRGYEISLHEQRPDMRKEKITVGRSINLALSIRGINALEKVGLKNQVLKECIPMKGRMVHPLGMPAFLSPYSGRPTDYINSVSRGGLNIALLNEAASMDNISICFNSQCQAVDIKEAVATFYDATKNETYTEQADIVIGTDGAGSAVRQSLMAKTTDLLFNYSQNFLPHGYKELSILPDVAGQFKIEKNALHIWPRDQFMIIALPNMDASFTVTMFLPVYGERSFNTINTREKVADFFTTYFSDLIPYMPHYVDEYFDNPVGTLGTIKCYPWQAYGKTLVMGDAAHAIVPFYGQGMNASFEDVSVFDEILDKHEGDWPAVFEAFQLARAENTNAIADLAIDNFTEMQDRVNDADFILKRKIEMQLEQQFPDYYSKYSLVTFRSEIPYAKAMHLGRKQDHLLLELCQKGRASQMSLENIHQQLMALQN